VAEQSFQIPMELIPTFLLLAEELNISRCARRLGISQPALTRQLQSLEESFGTQLFVRQSRGLALTQNGRTLKNELQPAFESLRGAVARLRESKTELSGPLNFGCFSEIGTNLIAPLLCEFAQTHPSIRTDVRYLSELEIIAGVSGGQLHLGLTSHAPASESLRSYKLLDERILLITSKHNPDLDKNPHPRFAGFRNADRLLVNFLKKQTEKKLGYQPDVVFAINSHQAMIEAVCRLGLYAALPHHSISAALKNGSIRLASRKELVNQVHLILPDSDYPERKTIELVKHLRSKFKLIEGAGA
jgi:DNA-binding transcriptional LysR family regulator